MANRTLPCSIQVYILQKNKNGTSETQIERGMDLIIYINAIMRCLVSLNAKQT